MGRNLTKTSAATSYTWDGVQNTTPTTHIVGNGAQMHLSVPFSALPRNPRIKKTDLVITQKSCNVTADTKPKLKLYALSDGVGSQPTEELLDYCCVRAATDAETVEYHFNITALLDKGVADGTAVADLAVVLADAATADSVELYGSLAESKTPVLHTTYESGYGIRSFARTHTHSLGRLGQGIVDLQTRNLMIESEDFAWGGCRMPVTIRHLYNSALAKYQYTENNALELKTADFSATPIGYGWKLNLMQSMVPTDFCYEGGSYSGFVFIDENGEETYFKPQNADDPANTMFEDVDDSEIVYNSSNRKLTMGGETYDFDEAGRLTCITDTYGNTNKITYSDGRLTAVTDGAGRAFTFTYDKEGNGYLTTITAPDGSVITYTYVDEYLRTITYPDGTLATFFYVGKKPSNLFIYEPNGKVGVRVSYTFDGDRLATVTEKGGYRAGGETGVVYPITTYT